MPNQKKKDDKVIAIEKAWMSEEGIICIVTTSYMPGDTVGDGWIEVKPDDNDYEVVKKKYGLQKPGDRFSSKTETTVDW
jgi:hypothetical protein